MPTVVIIGAGPVGLLTAIQIKLYQPSIQIKMFEKYQEYKRKHTLRVDAASFEGAHPDLKKYSGNVATSTIETELKEQALSLGIEISYEEVIKVDDVLKRYPDVSLCIGADGAHSLVRKTYFEHEDIPYQNLQYLLEFKCDVIGEKLLPLSWAQSAGALMHVDRLLTEQVGRYNEESQSTPLAIRMFISEKEFKALRGPQDDQATFKNPLSFDGLCQANPDLGKQFREWLNYRQSIQAMGLAPIKISTTNLPAYTSNSYVKGTHHCFIALVGDAALGVPYFRSFNAGIKGSILLADTANKWLNDDVYDFQEYENGMSTLAAHEIFHAHVKAKVLKVADTSVATSQASLATSRKVSGISKKVVSYKYKDSETDSDHDSDDGMSSSLKKKDCKII